LKFGRFGRFERFGRFGSKGSMRSISSKGWGCRKAGAAPHPRLKPWTMVNVVKLDLQNVGTSSQLPPRGIEGATKKIPAAFRNRDFLLSFDSLSLDSFDWC